jgi:hypothetical protein
MFEGVPAMYAAMFGDPVSEQVDLSSLTRCTVGGQTISVSTIQRWEARSGSRLIELWRRRHVLRARGHTGNRRLNKRWRSFTERGKNPLVANVEFARELAGWCWSLATM